MAELEMNSDQTESQAMSFETAMARLESLVRSMENGNTKLEDVIASFEQARKLSAYCQTQLDSLKQKIEILTKDGPDGQEWSDFRHDSGDGSDFIPGNSAGLRNVRREVHPVRGEADDYDNDSVPF